MDLLLTLQSNQSNKVTNVAHTAETTFATRRFHSAVFGKKYHEYWESRKDSTLKEAISNASRSAISSIQRLVHQNLIERANNVFSTSSSSSNCPNSNASFSDATSSDATSSDATSSGATTSNSLTKTLAQTIELASDYLAQLGVINLTRKYCKS
ncbi:hypothetical protein INT46_011294 [Mucor plumbeus]|uniref:Uncharacterized protein n=1 Tax=Mucor plumbeus TaxID=97098 RepID=A0A8H7QTK4_9FUNG|nr:hypothetical protein INT46_011294 [Mucor plumbeus]